MSEGSRKAGWGREEKKKTRGLNFKERWSNYFAINPSLPAKKKFLCVICKSLLYFWTLLFFSSSSSSFFFFFLYILLFYTKLSSFEKLGYLTETFEKISVGRLHTNVLSVYFAGFFFFSSSTKTLTWSGAKSHFHSLDLAAVFLRAVQLAGVWVSLFFSESHATVSVCSETELEESTCLALSWSMPISIKV